MKNSEPASGDNVEAGVDKFKEFAQQASLDQDSIVQEVVELLQLAATTNSTEEHKTEGAYGEEDKHYFIDINFSIFASDWEKYEEFMERTRHEYGFLNDDQYKNLRRKILQSFLQIPNIFATKEFRSEYEQVARENIAKEIDTLS
ncbi:hypothetical protein Ocin01_10602 [Orchesella cincta]|uniref:Uncharacterized protein n=1 Tax=Orchesella cincta TaxID=48709 RepID=A0A1D2MSV1_ORCCI|nr:hypothetical protein Ocin01_10602 [Orchesella cincta]